MQKSVQVRKNCMISTMNGQFQLELPIFEKRKNMNITVYLGANEGNPLYNFFTSVIQNQNFSPSSYTSSVSLHTSV